MNLLPLHKHEFTALKSNRPFKGEIYVHEGKVYLLNDTFGDNRHEIPDYCGYQNAFYLGDGSDNAQQGNYITNLVPIYTKKSPTATEQQRIIMRHLLDSGKKLTNRDLVKEQGIMSPTKRFSELLEQGYPLAKEEVSVPTRYSTKETRITVYSKALPKAA